MGIWADDRSKENVKNKRGSSKMKKHHQLLEDIYKFVAENNGAWPDKLKIRDDVLRQIEKDLFSMSGGMWDSETEKEKLDGKGPVCQSFNGIPMEEVKNEQEEVIPEWVICKSVKNSCVLQYGVDMYRG